eukprot:533774-Prymnesium_polylepis.1
MARADRASSCCIRGRSVGPGERSRPHETKGLIRIGREVYKPEKWPKSRRRQRTAPMLPPNTKVALMPDKGAER